MKCQQILAFKVLYCIRVYAFIHALLLFQVYGVCFSPTSLPAQTTYIDSLRGVLKTLPQDTNRVYVLNELSEMLHNRIPNESQIKAYEALKLAQQLQWKKGIASALQNCSKCLSSIGIQDSALSLEERALVIFEKLKDSANVGTSLNNIARIHRNSGRFDKAVEYSLLSLRFGELIHNTHVIKWALWHLGLIHFYFKQYEEALAYLGRAGSLNNGQFSSPHESATQGVIGQVYLGLKQPRKALQHFERAYKCSQASNNKRGQFISLGQFALTYLDLGNLDSASQFSKRAIATAESIGLEYADLPCTAARIALLQKRYEETETLLNRAFVALKVSPNHAFFSLGIYYTRYELEKARGDNKAALKAYEQYSTLSDSLTSTERLQIILIFQRKYETQTKEQEMVIIAKAREVQDAELARQTTFRNATVVVAVLIAALAAVLIRSNRRSQRDNAALTYKQGILEEQAIEIELTSTALQEKNLIIEQDRSLLARERVRSERLLLSVLPEAIAERMKAGEIHIADHFPAVTVLFADVVGFTKLSTNVNPQELVELLDSLFTALDALASKHGLEKIKTIGDAYMVVCGVPVPMDDHTERVARFALEIHSVLDAVRLRWVLEGKELGASPIRMRVGIHTGEAVAGVIGTSKFSYDLWGDTVNTASRMESHGEAGKIHISEECFHALVDHSFVFEERGEMEIKGKGVMRTYFLTGSSA
jgi:class 3 adenylate cyclase